MNFYVYMLKSKSIKPVTYVGYTNDLKKRISLHNSGKGAKFTRGRKWVLIYKEKFKSKSKAISREYYIKNNRVLRNKLKNKKKNENFNFITL
jgi:putative endonuclease